MTKGKLIDSLRLHVKGGPGGMGMPKYGGIGGSGGNVYVQAVEGKTLKEVLTKHVTKRISAKPGNNACRQNCLGFRGADVTIEVPLGITVYDPLKRELGELNVDGDRVMVARGGVGGHLGSGWSGTKGQAHVVTLDLKLIADVGFVGFPNAGKSTLLSVLSSARPKIASYPFTTLRPNVGMAMYHDLRQISLADLPGLIEGAHLNIGMGHRFLRHLERTKLLLMVVDIGGFRLSMKYDPRSCIETIILLNKELELYKEELLDKPALLVVNKMDTPGAQDALATVKQQLGNLRETFAQFPEEFRPTRPIQFEEVLAISAKNADKREIGELKDCIRRTLDYMTEEKTDYETKLVEKLEEKRVERGVLLV